MAKKFRDLDDDAQESFDEQLSAQAKSQGYDMWDSPDDRGLINELKETYGLCATCMSFKYCKQEYGGITTNVQAWCSQFKCDNKGIAPVTQCNMHNEKFTMSIEDMKEMAFILDFSEKEVGFHANRKVSAKGLEVIERQRKAKDLKRNKRLGIE